MKRSLVAMLWIGALAGATVVGLQKSGLLLRPEAVLAHFFFGAEPPNDGLGPGNYLFAITAPMGSTTASTCVAIT